jgi:hypothetical protein
MGRIRVNATDLLFGMSLGEVIMKVHDLSQCEGRAIPCCIHNPSDHHMVTWPMNWRADTGVMERRCVHDVGHPDPDHMAYVRSLTPEHECPGEDECVYPHLEWQGVHGCDGCCVGAS